MKILIITDSFSSETQFSSPLIEELAGGLKERGREMFVATPRPTAHNLPQGIKVDAGVLSRLRKERRIRKEVLV